MNLQSKHIHPVFDRIVGREEKEAMLQQHSCCLWLTGLSGSGKTTIAVALEKELTQRGYLTQILDGDNVRTGINSNLSFSEADRMENIRRIAEVSKLFVNGGLITINCFVSPTKAIRQQAKDIIGNQDFIEAFINTPFDICEQRDVKGLYAKARAGEIKNFTGLDAPFEKPESNFIDVITHNRSVQECVQQLLETLLPRIEFKQK